MTPSTSTFVALIRGINVGKAKRIAMADLRAMVEGLGCGDVRTILNSGNVVFTYSRSKPREIASGIESGIERVFGFSAKVTVLAARELARIIAENTLIETATNPSRLLVAIPRDASELKKLAPLRENDWSPDEMALGDRAAYLWCPNGLLSSPLPEAVATLLGDAVTSRNWSTISKLAAMVL